MTTGYGRVLNDEFDEIMPGLPAILLDGPKAIGKTATALKRCASVRRLDNPVQRELLSADPDHHQARPEACTARPVATGRGGMGRGTPGCR